MSGHDMSQRYALELRDICQAGKTVLDRVSVGIAPGAVIGLAGPNGAGKTTLMRIAAGLQIAESGSIVAGVQATLVDSTLCP